MLKYQLYTRWFITLMLLNPFQLAHSQNLVPNSSFDTIIDFGTDDPDGWHKVQNSDTPDYFNFQENKELKKLFNDYIGGTEPHNGSGFIGLFCYRVNSRRSIKNIREFIEVPLIRPLKKDSMYRIQLSLFLDGESNISVKKLGVYFTGHTMVNSKELKYLRVKPQVEMVLTGSENTHKWMTVEAFYNASGIEKFMVLGNFQTDNNTETIKVVADHIRGKREKWDLIRNEKASYYYIDDVVVEKVDKKKDIILPVQISESNIQIPFDINKLEIDSAIVLHNVFFNFDKYELLPKSYRELDRLYDLLNTNPSIRIKIEGHTDNVGGYEYNMDLSQKRVQSVAEYLIRKGIDSGRIETAGYGYINPVASNLTEEGRKQNRRVVFKIIAK